MRITIGGISFDVDPQTRLFQPQVQTAPLAAELAGGQLYLWNCRDQKGRYLMRLTADGALNLSNIVIFYEHDQPGPFGQHDKTATLQMKLKVLNAVQRPNISAIQAAINRLVGKHKIKIDLSAFDWLKPLASFAVWTRVDYHFFELSNATRGLRFYIAVPHAVDLRADVLGLCNRERLEEELANGRRMDDANLGLTAGGSRHSRELRRRYLRDRRRWLQEALEPGGLVPQHIRDELAQIDRDLKALDAQAEGD